MQGGHLINTHLMMECTEHINQDQRSFACGGGELSVSGPCVRALARVLLAEMRAEGGLELAWMP